MCPVELAGRRFSRLAAAALAVAALAAATAPGAAAEAPAAPSEGEAMTVRFPSRSARVAKPGALVTVRCAGTADRECTGTLTIEGLSESHTASYSVPSGEQRNLVVPLGGERGFFTGIGSPKMQVVAETMQPSGGLVRTARLLRFK